MSKIAKSYITIRSNKNDGATFKFHSSRVFEFVRVSLRSIIITIIEYPDYFVHNSLITRITFAFRIAISGQIF